MSNAESQPHAHRSVRASSGATWSRPRAVAGPPTPQPTRRQTRPAGCPTAWRDLFPDVQFRTLATGSDTLITSLRFAPGSDGAAAPTRVDSGWVRALWAGADHDT